MQIDKFITKNRVTCTFEMNTEDRNSFLSITKASAFTKTVLTYKKDDSLGDTDWTLYLSTYQNGDQIEPVSKEKTFSSYSEANTHFYKALTLLKKKQVR